jgi:peptidoglycan hydrolase-like protein with peptidoglycan-binding domain
MAYERTTNEKIKGDSLEAFVSNLANSFSVQMKIRNAEDELKFNDSVVNKGLGVKDQLDYRKEQLKRIKDDPTERARIKGEISALEQRVEQQEFTDAYTDKLINYSSGMSSIDSVIDFLTSQKASATDQTIIDAINKEIITKQNEKFQLTTNLIKDQTEYAINDKSVEIIDDQISKVQTEKNKALLAGNDTVVASLNLQIQALNKAKTESSINRDIKNFAASTITGYASATALLDAYNTKIEGASDGTPITIGDITYSSAKEFWTYKRDSYISDNSSSGLFARVSSEVDAKIKTAASKNMLDSKTLQSYTKDITNLAGRSELVGYESKIDQTKQDALQGGANLITDSVTDKYATDYDINKAISSLNVLKSIGVNVDSAYAKIMVAGANVKSGQVSSILSAAQNALANDPNMTPEAAINMAIQSGAGIVKTPEELAQDTAGKLATDLAANKDATANTNNPKLSLPQTPTTPTTTPTTVSGTLRFGSTGESVKQIQSALGITADGNFGAQTKAAVIAYQQKNGLTVDGIVGPQTTASLLKTPTAPTPTKTVTPAPTQTPTKTTQSKTVTPAPQPTPTVTPAAPAPKTTYQGSSIVDYLGTVGQDASYSARAKLAASKGISNYTGSASQNTQLLKTLRGF